MNPDQSKDQRAEDIFGKRKPGTPLFCPEELGFVCPVCNYGDTFTDGDLQWSEYNCMLWCPKCNLDIPSFLCVKYAEPRLDNEPLSPRERIMRSKDLLYKTFLVGIVKESEELRGGQ
jgi:hypothetical protein